MEQTTENLSQDVQALDAELEIQIEELSSEELNEMSGDTVFYRSSTSCSCTC